MYLFPVPKFFCRVLVLAGLITPRYVFAEWGFEGAIGGNPTAYYNENLRKNNSSYQSEISGRRHALSFTSKAHYEWIGVRFMTDYYFAGTGSQKTRSSTQAAPNQGYFEQQTEQSGVAFSSAISYRGELQLRRFNYGHREIFAFNTGLVYRRVVTELSGQAADYAAQGITYRYYSLGFTFEPLLAYFGRYELTLPIDFGIGLKFPQGGIIQGGGPGAVLFATGLRLQQEPRGFFVVMQGMVNFFDTPYTVGNADYSFGQTEVTLRLSAGYYFRNTLYNE